MKLLKAGIVLVLTALLFACSKPVTVGSKKTTENRLLGEMFIQLMEKQGIPAKRRLGLGDSAENFQALRDGDIDIYPEYTGTALTHIGLPLTTNHEKALQNVRKALSQVGLEYLQPLGFKSNYVIVTREGIAKKYDLHTIAELRSPSNKLRLGVTAGYTERASDGLSALQDRYGLTFKNVQTLSGDNRTKLYNDLIDNKIDVMVGISTDPEIKDFGLVTLQDNHNFFPDYQAAPVVAKSALKRYPKIREALSELAGRIDTVRMEEMTRQVQLSGRSIQSVAAEALANLGLSSGEAIKKERPLLIATDPSTIGGSVANLTLRAVRTALPGRGIGFLASDLPMQQITDRKARMALVPSIALFNIASGAVSQDTRFETLAVVDSTYLYALALDDGPSRLGEARKIAAGPVASASYKLASMIATAQQPTAQVIALQNLSVSAAVSALNSGQADAVVILAARQTRNFENELGTDTHPVRLISAANWWRGAARLKLPFLRQATLHEGLYSGQANPIHTVAMQTTLVGPAPPEDSPLGRSGPSTFSGSLQPVPDSVVLTINKALGAHPDAGPHLHKAAALTPKIKTERTVLNPSPSHAGLMIAIFVYLVFAGWLLVRKQPDS